MLIIYSIRQQENIPLPDQQLSQFIFPSTTTTVSTRSTDYSSSSSSSTSSSSKSTVAAKRTSGKLRSSSAEEPLQSTAVVQLESVPVDQPKPTQHQQQPEEAVESVDQPAQEAREQSTTNGQQEPGGQPGAETVVSIQLRTVTNVQVKWADDYDKPLVDVQTFLVNRDHLPLKKRALKKVLRKSNTARRLSPREVARRTREAARRTRFKSSGPVVKRSRVAGLVKPRVVKQEPKLKTCWTYNFPEPDNNLS